jgi:hypothetical protein
MPPPITSTAPTGEPEISSIVRLGLDLPFQIDQGIVQTDPDTRRAFGWWRLSAHIALEGDIGVRLNEEVPGRTSGPAEGALAVLFARDDGDVAAIAFRIGVLSGQDGDKEIVGFVPENPDAGTPGVGEAVPWVGMKG